MNYEQLIRDLEEFENDFITCKDDDSYELVTELVITWYNK